MIEHSNSLPDKLQAVITQYPSVCGAVIEQLHVLAHAGASQDALLTLAQQDQAMHTAGGIPIIMVRSGLPSNVDQVTQILKPRN